MRAVSKCSLLSMAWPISAPLGGIIGQTEVVLISKDQKDLMLQSS